MKPEDFVTESPIEARLLAAVLPKLHPSVVFESQRPVSAGVLRYRVDFCAAASGRVVVIECDGRDFHSFNEDRFRDVAMLDIGGMTDVIRFRGSDIHFDPGGCVEKMSQFFPFLFDPSAEPWVAADLFAISGSLLGGHVKPIIRCRVPLFRPPEGNYQAAMVMGLTTDHRAMVAEFKTPYWSWKYEGPRVQTIGDCVDRLLDDMADRQGVVRTKGA